MTTKQAISQIKEVSGRVSLDCWFPQGYSSPGLTDVKSPGPLGCPADFPSEHLPLVDYPEGGTQPEFASLWKM